jgi:hypothetical protein
VVQGFRYQSCADHNEAGEKHDEDRRTVAGIGKAIIQAANLASWPQADKAIEEFPAAAARTAARQAGDDRSTRSG